MTIIGKTIAILPVLGAILLGAAGLAGNGGERLLAAEAAYIDPSALIPMPTDPKVPNTKIQRRGSRILYRSLEPRDEGWLLNRQLSRACRRGEFKQRADRRYVALFAAEVYGAGVGGHGSLIDKGRRGVPQTLYIFKGQGTTYCRVYHRSQG